MIHCPSCAAGLRFDIEKQQMICDHCDSCFNVKDIRDRTKDDAKNKEFFDTYVYICPDCGGELATTEKNDAIGFCPFCDGSSMLYDRVRENWKPDYIIPFKVKKEQCREAYIKEVKRHPFVSSDYRKPELLESFRGIYMPYLSFEGEQKGTYIVRKSKVEKTGKKVITTVYDQNYHVNYQLSGYSHDASANFDDHLSERLEPYHKESRQKFHPAYVSGFYAEIGDVDEEDYKDLVASKMQDYTSDKISKTHDTKSYLKIPTEVHSVENELHPVWFMSYRKKNRITYATVNGETGKVAADLPLSPLRILLAALLASVLAFGFFFAFFSLLPSVKASTTLMMCSIIMTAGLYYLLDSYIGTVTQSLRISDVTPSNKYQNLLVGIATALSVIGSMLIANDGSYSQGRSVFGCVLLIPSAIFFVVRIVKQISRFGEIKSKLRTSAVSQLENEIIDTSKKYNYIFLSIHLTGLLLALSCIILSVGDVLSKFAGYLLCGFMGAVVILDAFLHIRFQTVVAKRRSPQMNKKGAFYDEK